MEAADVDDALEELEMRLERLRALYQQYFLGIEKIEPTVARKDVDRRIWIMRRAQIRNTRRRFKFNTLVQRYNTYMQYWQRVLREIENGTYIRHLLKAEKRFGSAPLTIAEKRRLGLFRNSEDGEAQENRAGSRSSIADAERDLAAMLDGNVDPVEEAKRAVDALGAPPSSRTVETERDATPQPASVRPPSAPLDDLDLDLDFLGASSKPNPASPSRGGAAPRPAAAAPDRADPGRTAGPARPVPNAAAASPAEPRKRPPPTPSRRGSQRSPGAPAAASPQRPLARETWPAPEVPAARPAPRAARPRPAVAQADDGGLPDARVKELYGRLVEAKRQTKEGTRGVTMDGLARTLRSTLPKLRHKHAGKQLDFDVVIRNGKAVVKPIVKK